MKKVVKKAQKLKGFSGEGQKMPKLMKIIEL